jgi:hypothetical protein
MIDMTVGDQNGVNLPDQVTPLSEQVNARFPGIDEKMPPLKQKQGTGEKPVFRGDARSRSKETDGSHGKKVRGPA